MVTLKYKCTLLSDIIINVKSASEGVNQTLDFIPGSNFMGIVAGQLYAKNDPDTMLIVHSSQVKFGDAHPLVENERSLKIPLSMYFPKTKTVDELCIIHHCYDRNADKNKFQLKQCRDGFYAFFSSSGTMEKVLMNKTYSIKSAYDKKHRRSQDGQLYGYESIPEGMVYCFCIQCPSEDIAAKIDHILQGRQHIGRSRTAQYGLVKIERCNYNETASTKNPEGSDYVVYAESRLIFYDDNGMPTLQPDARQLCFQGGTVDWSKSQIRTFMYSPWNFKRQSFDFDRCGIEKGSVIYVKGASKVSDNEYVGAFNNEGFGKVIYNPDFLEARSGTNGEAKYIINNQRQSRQHLPVINPDTPLIRYLERKKSDINISDSAYKEVNEFISQNAYLFKEQEFASQWGHIRELACQYSDPKILYIQIEEYLSHGVAAEKWAEKGRIDIINKLFKKIFKINDGIEIKDVIDKINPDSANTQLIIINLASEMAKKCR